MIRLGQDRRASIGSTGPAPEPSAEEAGWWLPLPLLALAFALASYFVARAGAHLADSDSGELAAAIRTLQSTGTLNSSSGIVYSNGYAYEAVSAFVLTMTGLSVPDLIQIYYPLISGAAVLPAWALYREFVRSRRGAAIAVTLLFLQPEFLFMIFRGSHERMLRFLMLTAIWLLVRSFRYRDRPMEFASHVVLFYVVTFALIATNAFFGLSFVVALTVAFAAGWALSRRYVYPFGATRAVTLRLAFAALSSGVLAFLFIYYVYTPAQIDVKALGTVGQRLATLFLTTSDSHNPYTQVAAGWVSLPVYFLLSVSDYLLIAISGVIWLRLGIGWFRKSRPQPSLALWFLWLLYGAFAFQGGLAMLADLTGLLGGNLQDRSFPSFAMVATPLVAWAVARWQPPRWAVPGYAVAAAALAVLALVKATDEPILSNKWLFYVPNELHVLSWVSAHDRDDVIWIGLDERLSTAYELAVGTPDRGNQWDIYTPKAGTRAFLVTNVIRLQSSRLHRPLPPFARADRVYDNGQAQLYRLLPATPFQH